MSTKRDGRRKRATEKSGATLADAFREMEKPDDRPEVVQLLANIKARLPELEKLLESASDHWGYEDPVYRFYHQSWKVYGLQDRTRAIVEVLQSLAPERPLNSWFEQIIRDGTGRGFKDEYNRRWLPETRPILEAFFHARYFLDMAVRYGKELDHPPRCLPSGWAAVLYLYGMR